MNVDNIFNAISKASNLMILQNERDQKKAQIKSCSAKRCGNCDLWMKSSCKPEKKMGQFKSCNSFACNDFALCPHTNQLIEKFTSQLANIEQQIKEIV